MFASSQHSLKITEETLFRNPKTPVELKSYFETKLLCMKKIYSLLQNENVQAGIVIASIFLITGLITLFTMYA